MNPKVDEFMLRTNRWQDEMIALRQIVLDCQLTEELKWKQPCYSFNGGNIGLMGNFKNFLTFSFFKGELMKDDLKVLHSPGENSQAVKLMKFTSVKEILDQAQTIKSYLYEAIEIEKAGLKIEFKKNSEIEFAEELLALLDKKPELKKAFYGLTPGRQRGYNIHILGAKQAKTRESRAVEVIPKIMSGKGMQDCTCGHSKRMPRCDGSHKYL